MLTKTFRLVFIFLASHGALRPELPGSFCEHHATCLSQHQELSLLGTLNGRPFPERCIFPHGYIFTLSFSLFKFQKFSILKCHLTLSWFLAGWLATSTNNVWERPYHCYAWHILYSVFLRHKVFIFYFWPCHVTYGILVSRPGSNPGPLWSEAWSPNLARLPGISISYLSWNPSTCALCLVPGSAIVSWIKENWSINNNSNSDSYFLFKVTALFQALWLTALCMLAKTHLCKTSFSTITVSFSGWGNCTPEVN